MQIIVPVTSCFWLKSAVPTVVKIMAIYDISINVCSCYGLKEYSIPLGFLFLIFSHFLKHLLWHIYKCMGHLLQLCDKSLKSTNNIVTIHQVKKPDNFYHIYVSCYLAEPEAWLEELCILHGKCNYIVCCSTTDIMHSVHTVLAEQQDTHLHAFAFFSLVG